QISTLLASPGPVDRTLGLVAAKLVGLLDLSACALSTEDGREVEARSEVEPRDPRGGGPVASFELTSSSRSLGRMTAERERDGDAFGPGERTLLQAVAAQVG